MINSMEDAKAEIARLVKRAEEAERKIGRSARRASEAQRIEAENRKVCNDALARAEAAESKLALAERVVEAAEKVRSQRATMGSLDAVFSLGAALGGLRNAVAEYRKAVGK